MLTIKREISIPIQTADIAGAYAYIYVHLGDIRKSEDKLQEAINCYGESKKIITCFKESSYSAKMQTLSGLDYIEALILYKTGEIHKVLGENLTSISYFRQSIEIVKQHDSIDALELYLTQNIIYGSALSYGADFPSDQRPIHPDLFKGRAADPGPLHGKRLLLHRNSPSEKPLFPKAAGSYSGLPGPRQGQNHCQKRTVGNQPYSPRPFQKKCRHTLQ